MAKAIDKYKEDLIGKVISYTELENYMNTNDYYLCEDDREDDVIRFTNYKRELWIDAETDGNDLLVQSIRPVTKKKDEKTRVNEFSCYEDLEKVLNYFKEKNWWNHWLAGWICTSLGRRVGDTLSLKWSDFFYPNGIFKDRMNTLKEEKTGKIVGVRINALAQEIIKEYCEHEGINPMNHYREKIFSTGDKALRKAMKEAVMETKIKGNISTHSFRKYYANTLYRLHPDDADNLKIIQSILGHSSEEITKIYIGEIDRKIDKYNEDYADYMMNMRNGIEMEFNNSPIVRFKTDDFRDIILFAMNMRNTNELTAFTSILDYAEQKMV